MNTWAKYVVSFFVLVVVLSVVIYTFGPREYRDAYRSGKTPVGQLSSDAHLVSPGQAK